MNIIKSFKQGGSDIYIDNGQMNYCTNNEYFWVYAVNSMQDSQNLAKPSIEYREVDLKIGLKKYTVLAPFKSDDRNSFGKISGLILINGCAYVISLQGEIIRRSTLSQGIINQIANLISIPDIKTPKYVPLIISQVSDSKMHKFYEGDLTVKNKYYQYRSIIDYIYMKSLSSPDNEDLDYLMTNWVNSIPTESLNDGIIHEFLRYKMTFPKMFIAIIKRISTETLPITSITLLKLTSGLTYEIHRDLLDSMIMQFLEESAPNQSAFTDTVRETYRLWSKLTSQEP